LAIDSNYSCISLHHHSESFFIAFLPVIVAENGRLSYLESIVNKFKQLTMAEKGIIKAIVTTIMVSLAVQW
jgi:F0F1-type ATP synthase delta subunit